MEYERVLSKYDYADLRIEKGSDSVIGIKDDETKVSAGSFFGMSVRVLHAGAWGFASSNKTENVEELLKKAEKLASVEKSRNFIAEVKPEKKTVKEKYSITDPSEQAAALLDAKKKMTGKYLISRMLSCSDMRINFEFYSSEGAEIRQDYSYSYLNCVAVAKSGNVVQRGFETAASKKGFAGLDVHRVVGDAAETAERLIFAKPPPRGKFTAVLDPEMTGVFSHEAVGHASEADSIAANESILAGKLDFQLADEAVNITDDPSLPYFGHYKYDDEGVKGRKTEIIKNGKLVNYLNSRGTAKETETEPNGHGRAESYSAVPIARMSNTFFQPGKLSKEDVFDVRKGIYLKGMQGGSVDTFSGGFMFKAEQAYILKSGEEQELLRDVTVTGNIIEVLRNISAVGKDFGTSPGMCGKLGQSIPVEDGGPHIRVENMIVG
jgi:TldD protein